MRSIMRSVAVVAACSVSFSLSARAEVPKPPVVAGSHLAPMTDIAPLVVATPTSVTIAGEVVATLKAGAFSAEDKEGGTFGLNAPKLGQAVEKLRAAKMSGLANPDVRAGLLVDPALPYATLLTIVVSLKFAHVTKFAAVVTENGKAVAWPFTRPDISPEPPKDPGLVITLDTKTGGIAIALHGKPKQTIAWDKRADLGPALAAIAKADKLASVLLVPAEDYPVGNLYDLADRIVGAGITDVRIR